MRYTLSMLISKCGFYHNIASFGTINECHADAKRRGISVYKIRSKKWNIDTNKYEDIVIFDSKGE